MSGKMEKKYKLLADEFPQKEPIGFDLDHIPLPNLHPNPNTSINLTKEVINVIDNNDSYNYFLNIYQSYDIEERYYFTLYYLEYIKSDNYDSFLLNKIKEEYLGDSNPWKPEKESYRDWSNRIAYRLPEHYNAKLKSLLNVTEHLLLRQSFAKTEIKRLYQKKLKNIGFDFTEDPSILAYTKLDQNNFRVDITRNSEDYIYELRKTLGSINSNSAIDAFISNSFTFQSNRTKIELLSLKFGNRNETNNLFHKLYESHKRIVKSPKVTKLDFARIMFLNVKTIRDNFNKHSTLPFDIDYLENYLKKSVAKNIRPDIPFRA